jgi:riboflavin kinase / FMN adenylyltransferase
MQLIRDVERFSSGQLAPCALTIGNFDGVHMGHQAMLARVVATARENGHVAAAMSFWPSPQEYFGRAAPRIYSIRQKLEAFRAAGIQRVYLLRFSERYAKMDAEVFVQQVLKNQCAAASVLTGEDFRFGRNRAGDIWTLRALMGESAQVMPEVLVGGERVSSSRVRRVLGEGNFGLVSQLLGQPYSINGHISHGDKLGRTLGFPTANIALRRPPAVTGVFAVEVEGVSAKPWPGVASIGVRPTVKLAGKPLAEVYLFDFQGQLYGKRVKIVLKEKLRNEEKYASVDEMTAQIARDVEGAKKCLKLA